MATKTKAPVVGYGENDLPPKAASNRVETAPTATITQITQAELVAYIGLKNQIEKLEKELGVRSENLKELLGAGIAVEEGTHVAEIKFSERRTPSWKEEAIGLADKLKGKGEGEKWAEKVMAATEPTPMTKLVVK